MTENESEYWDDNLGSTLPKTDKQVAKFEKEVKAVTKNQLEYEIEFSKFHIELSKLNEKDREKRLNQAKNEHRFDCYDLSALQETLNKKILALYEKRLGILEKIYKEKWGQQH
jgi:hypothetical protein